MAREHFSLSPSLPPPPLTHTHTHRYRARRNMDVTRTAYAATDNLATIGAIRLFQGRAHAAEQYIRGAVQSFSSLIISQSNCDPLKIRANLNYVLLKSINGVGGRGQGENDDVIRDLLFWSERLRCAFSERPNWREAQARLDLAQFYALRGLGEDASTQLIRSKSQIEMLIGVEENHHPLLVRARNMNRSLEDIFSHDPSRDLGDVMFEFELRLDDTMHTIEVRQNQNVMELVENFTRAVRLEDADSIRAILHAIYSRRASFLSSFGGPAVKYDY